MFLQDDVRQSAVIMQLQVLGETSKKLNDVTKEKINVPWKKIIGLRNVIAHDYFALKLDFVWQMASQDVPVFEEELRAYLKAEGTDYIPPFGDRTPMLD